MVHAGLTHANKSADAELEARRTRVRSTASPSATIGLVPGSTDRRAAQRNTVAAIQRTTGNRAASRYIRRHPNHAEEQEVLRSPATGIIQRESKAKRKARMEKKYGVKLTGDLPESMLKKIDEILKLLPRSHT